MSSSAQLELLFDSRETGAPEGVPPADAAPRATPGPRPRLTRRPRRVCRIRPRPLGRTAADAVPECLGPRADALPRPAAARRPLARGEHRRTAHRLRAAAFAPPQHRLRHHRRRPARHRAQLGHAGPDRRRGARESPLDPEQAARMARPQAAAGHGAHALAGRRRAALSGPAHRHRRGRRQPPGCARATPTPRGTATRCGWPCPPTPTRAASATPPRPGCNSAPAPGSARAWRISCRSAA